MRIVSEKNIEKISFLYAIIVVAVITFSTGTLLIVQKINTFKKELAEIEQTFINQQRKQLKNDVEATLARIDARREYMEELLQNRLKTRVKEALAIAGNIYENLHEQVPEGDIAKIIREAIRPIRFNEKQGYFFIISLNGDSVLYPADSTLEGTNFLTNEVDNISYVAENLIMIAEESGKGFYRYDWTRPDDNSGRLYKKTSYVSLFKPLGWIIGTGEYNSNLNNLAKATITRELKVSLSIEQIDYYFVYDVHNLQGGKDFATMLINNNRPDLIGKKLSDDFTDAKGKQFRKEFLQGINESGEAYVVYWYKKTDGSGLGRKLSYFQLYPDWNWIVARGIYFDRLDQTIAAKKITLGNKVKRDILLLCAAFLIAVTIALFIAYRFSKELQSIFNRYKTTQLEQFEKLEELNRTLEIQSNTDSLTRISNRGFFNVQLTNETSRTTRYNSPLSVVMFDIDHFKLVNDSKGHLVGDTVLQELASLVQKHIRLSDLFARWGGEEFAVLLPGINLEQAIEFAEKLRSLIEKFHFSHNLTITCSFGVSCFQPPEDDDTLIHRVDKALYQAKADGRNCCVSL